MLGLSGTTTRVVFYNTRTQILSHPLPNLKSFINLPNRSPPSIITMSSSPSSAAKQIVEHFVLFKINPATDPSKVNAMVNGLSALTSLDSVLHLAAAPVLRHRSSAASALTFTHLLHSRYASKSDLEAYATHPAHVAVVTDHVRPIAEDIMAVDWVSGEIDGPVAIPPGSAVRVSFLKMKEGCEADEVLGVIGGLKGRFEGIEQVSYGVNFSPGRAKGYSIGSLAVFKGVKEMEAVDLEEAAEEEEKEKVRGKLDGVVVLDFVVSPPHSASL